MSAKTYYLLGGDIGGTNTRLQLYKLTCVGDIQNVQGRQPPGEKVFGMWYANADFPQSVDIIRRFFADLQASTKAGVVVQSSDVAVACLAVAGPVNQNKVEFTNRTGWSLCGSEIAKALGIGEVQLVNDFVAQGYGLLSLDVEKDCVSLHQAKADRNAPIACIGPGTGLGECYLTPSNEGYRCFSSEGGHAEYAPRTQRDQAMLQSLRAQYNSIHRISVERVVSGPGIANIYAFLAEREPEKVNKEFHEKFLKAGDLQGKVVAENAPHCPLCNEALEVFVASYGSEAGVAALKWMPFGGLFLAGGLTPKYVDRLADPKGGFLTAYFDKGRVSPFLQNVPLYAVKTEDLGERGAHWKAVAMLREIHQEALAPTQLTELPSRTVLAALAALLTGFALGAAVARRR